MRSGLCFSHVGLDHSCRHSWSCSMGKGAGWQAKTKACGRCPGSAPLVAAGRRLLHFPAALAGLVLSHLAASGKGAR
jgi:hypothetical protein